MQAQALLLLGTSLVLETFFFSRADLYNKPSQKY